MTEVLSSGGATFDESKHHHSHTPPHHHHDTHISALLPIAGYWNQFLEAADSNENLKFKNGLNQNILHSYIHDSTQVRLFSMAWHSECSDENKWDDLLSNLR